jgi:hypothetical protein
MNGDGIHLLDYKKICGMTMESCGSVAFWMWIVTDWFLAQKLFFFQPSSFLSVSICICHNCA